MKHPTYTPATLKESMVSDTSGLVAASLLIGAVLFPEVAMGTILGLGMAQATRSTYRLARAGITLYKLNKQPAERHEVDHETDHDINPVIVPAIPRRRGTTRRTKETAAIH